jgi:hypothetical protein
MSANNASWRRHPSRGAPTITQDQADKRKEDEGDDQQPRQRTVPSRSTWAPSTAAANPPAVTAARAVWVGCRSSLSSPVPNNQESLRAVPCRIKRPQREVCDVDASPPFLVPSIWSPRPGGADGQNGVATATHGHLECRLACGTGFRCSRASLWTPCQGEGRGLGPVVPSINRQVRGSGSTGASPREHYVAASTASTARR